MFELLDQKRVVSHNAFPLKYSLRLLAKQTNSKTRETELLWRLAEVHHDVGNYNLAVTDAESAFALAHSLHLPKLEFLATTPLGQSYAAQKKVGVAIQTLQRAVAQLETMRGQVAGSGLESQLFLENKVTTYHALVDLSIKLDKLVEALLFAERAKARALLDVLSNGKSDLSKVLSPADKSTGFRLRQGQRRLSGSPRPRRIICGRETSASPLH